MDDAANDLEEPGDIVEVALELEYDIRRLVCYSELICILGSSHDHVSPVVLFVIGEQMALASDAVERAWKSILRSHRRAGSASATAS